MWILVIAMASGFTIGWFSSKLSRSVQQVDSQAALLRDLNRQTKRARQAEAAANYYRQRTISAEGQRTHVQHVDRYDVDHPVMRGAR